MLEHMAWCCDSCTLPPQLLVIYPLPGFLLFLQVFVAIYTFWVSINLQITPYFTLYLYWIRWHHSYSSILSYFGGQTLFWLSCVWLDDEFMRKINVDGIPIIDGVYKLHLIYQIFWFFAQTILKDIGYCFGNFFSVFLIIKRNGFYVIYFFFPSFSPSKAMGASQSGWENLQMGHVIKHKIFLAHNAVP